MAWLLEIPQPAAEIEDASRLAMVRDRPVRSRNVRKVARPQEKNVVFSHQSENGRGITGLIVPSPDGL